MSRDTVVAKRYAKALFELASEQQVVAKVEAELKLVADTVEQDQEIQKFLALPNVEAEKKAALFKSAFGDHISALVLNMVELLISRRRHDLIAAVCSAYTTIAEEMLGQANATVFSAKPLSEKELAEIAAQFGQLTGKTIIAQQLLEPELLGGVKVRIGDRLYDGSLAGKLDRLQKSIKV